MAIATTALIIFNCVMEKIKDKRAKDEIKSLKERIKELESELEEKVKS